MHESILALMAEQAAAENIAPLLKHIGLINLFVIPTAAGHGLRIMLELRLKNLLLHKAPTPDTIKESLQLFAWLYLVRIDLNGNIREQIEQQLEMFFELLHSWKQLAPAIPVFIEELRCHFAGWTPTDAKDSILLEDGMFNALRPKEINVSLARYQDPRHSLPALAVLPIDQEDLADTADIAQCAGIINESGISKILSNTTGFHGLLTFILEENITAAAVEVVVKQFVAQHGAAIWPTYSRLHFNYIVCVARYAANMHDFFAEFFLIRAVAGTNHLHSLERWQAIPDRLHAIKSFFPDINCTIEYNMDPIEVFPLITEAMLHDVKLQQKDPVLYQLIQVHFWERDSLSSTKFYLIAIMLQMPACKPWFREIYENGKTLLQIKLEAINPKKINFEEVIYICMLRKGFDDTCHDRQLVETFKILIEPVQKPCRQMLDWIRWAGVKEPQLVASTEKQRAPDPKFSSVFTASRTPAEDSKFAVPAVGGPASGEPPRSVPEFKSGGPVPTPSGSFTADTFATAGIALAPTGAIRT